MQRHKKIKKKKNMEFAVETKKNVEYHAHCTQIGIYRNEYNEFKMFELE